MLYVAKSGLPGAGKGLFTDKPIRKGTRVVEYTGEIITLAEYEERTQNDRYGYLLYVDKDHCIDAYRCRGALARYANDAKGIYRKKGLFNNCKYDIVGKRGYIVAFRNIPAHAEILVGYGKSYWDDLKYNMRLDRERARRKASRKRKKRSTRSANRPGN
jgi:SET domain-containing protein